MRNQVRCSDDNTGPWKALHELDVLPCLSQAGFEVWSVQIGRNDVRSWNEIKLTEELVISCPADSTEIGLVASRRHQVAGLSSYAFSADSVYQEVMYRMLFSVELYLMNPDS